MSHRQIPVVVLAVVGALILLAPPPPGIPGELRPAAALVVVTIGLWATGAVPEHLAALGFFTLASVFEIAAPGAIFSGFASSAMWLVFGGLVIGTGVGRTGLAAWLSRRVLGRPGDSYARLVAVLVLGATVLGFLVPSAIGRAVILMPMVLSLAERIGFEVGHPGRTGMVIATALTTYWVPLAILPANLPNVMLLGTADTLYGVTLTYGHYLLMNFPVMGVLKGVVLLAVVCWRFPARIPDTAGVGESDAELTPEGRRMLVLVTLALVLWATDAWHGISPGWIATAIAIVSLLPGVGVVSPESFREGVSLETLLYVAGVLGMGAVVASSGLGEQLAKLLLAELDFESAGPAYAYGSFTGLSFVLSLFATNPGTIAIVAPLAGDASLASGVPLTTLLLTILTGCGVLAFPYQAAPVLVALRLGRASIVDAMRVTLPVAAITVVFLVPLNYGWWRLVGAL